MKLISLVILSLSTLLVSAAPVAEPTWVDPNVDCDLTASSPKGTHMETALEVLWNKPHEYCVQTSTVAPFCTELTSYNGATIAICGPKGFSMRCDDVAIDTWMIADTCYTLEGDWKVGGRYHREKGAPDFAGIVLYQK